MWLPCLLCTVTAWSIVAGFDGNTTITSDVAGDGQADETVTRADLNAGLNEMALKTRADLNDMATKIEQSIAEQLKALNIASAAGAGKKSDVAGEQGNAYSRQVDSAAYTKFGQKMAKVTEKVDAHTATLVARIEEDYADNPAKIAILKKKVEKRGQNIKAGIASSKEGFKDLEEKAQTDPDTRDKLAQLGTNLDSKGNQPASTRGLGAKMGNVMGGLKQLGGKAIKAFKTIDADTAGTIVTCLTESVDGLFTIMDPETSWQERGAAAFEIAAMLAGFLPPPAGIIAPAMFGLISAVLGASAPETDEFKQLRNQILNGVTELFDETQKAEALGCVYKIEFLMGVMNIHDSSVMTEKEFYALIMVGGIDTGVATLGALKHHMETARDKNNLLDGTRAIKMAEFYVLIADARDILQTTIIDFIGLSGEKGGMTSKFFDATRKMNEKDYQNLFWLDDNCCENHPDHYAALLAYNVPSRALSGKDNTIYNIQRFLLKYRSQEYYDDPHNGMTEQSKLSIDTMGQTDDGEVRVVRGDRFTLDTALFSANQKYLYKNIGQPTWFFGLHNEELYESGSQDEELVCDEPGATGSKDWHTNWEGKVVWNVANDENNYMAQVRWTPYDDNDKNRLGDPNTGTFKVWRKNKEYFLTDSDGMLKKREEIMDSETQEGSSTRAEELSEIKKAMDFRKKYELFGMCAWGYKYDKSRVNWSNEMDHASVRVYRTKLKDWPTERWFISPAARYSAAGRKDTVTIGHATSGQGDKAYKDVLISQSGGSGGDSDKATLNKAELEKDEWKLIMYTREINTYQKKKARKALKQKKE